MDDWGLGIGDWGLGIGDVVPEVLDEVLVCVFETEVCTEVWFCVVEEVLIVDGWLVVVDVAVEVDELTTSGLFALTGRSFKTAFSILMLFLLTQSFISWHCTELLHISL